MRAQNLDDPKYSFLNDGEGAEYYQAKVAALRAEAVGRIVSGFTRAPSGRWSRV